MNFGHPSGPISGSSFVATRSNVAQKPRVLVVDDDAAFRNLLRKALQREGCTVLEAASGEEALALLMDRNRTLDVIVFDYQLPGMTGEDVI